MTLTPVAHDWLATIVTTLEMRERPAPRPLPPWPLRLTHWPKPDPANYRLLFGRVGAPWLWYSRLALDDGALCRIIGDPEVDVFAVVDPYGIEVGLLELDRRVAGACAIAYFALVPELTGHGNGRWLMAQTLALAWRPGIERVWLNTCTLDHPSALGFYRKQGFTPVARTIETFADPRALGLLPVDAAPQIPYLASRR